MKQLILILFSLIVLACNSNKRSIPIGEEIAEGNIDKDSTYNGLIKFYEAKSHKLTEQATFRNNLLEGQRVIFYPNGKAQVKSEYRDGKATGFTRFYNEQGQLELEQYFYYGLRAGHSTHFKDNQPHKYYFTSLDNEELFYIGYDSIGSKGIAEIQKDFFFYNRKPLQLVDFNKRENRGEYFIYLVNPPKYNFSYSLCLIDEKYNVLETIQKFDSTQVWETFFIDTAQKRKGQFFALRLEIDDQINDTDAVMFKKLL